MVPFDENHSFLDRPEILNFIFYPRREDNPVPSIPNATNVLVPVDRLNSLGIPIQTLSGVEDRIFSNLEKIKKILLPTLIIHAEKDHIIPLNHARDLYEASPATHKRLVIIANANHNDLLMVGQSQYFEALMDFTSLCRDRLSGIRRNR